LPLSWVASTASNRWVNFGDALSAIVVGAVAGRKPIHAAFDSKAERMSAIGTIGHALKNGKIHVWGTGLDRRVNPADPTLKAYVPPPDTEFLIHATRGPFTRAAFADHGVPAAEVYGDPALLLPGLFDFDLTKTWDLGVVVHITELDGIGPEARVKAGFRRYHIPEELASRIQIINTWTAPDARSVLAKVEEIGRCRRIVSTSLHGVIIGEMFGIPSLYFHLGAGGLQTYDVTAPDCPLDHRLRDHFAGTGRSHVTAFGAPRHLATPWEELLGQVDTGWTPIRWDPRPLLEAFPAERAAWPRIALDNLPAEVTDIRF
jgi:hypothetical protein